MKVEIIRGVELYETLLQIANFKHWLKAKYTSINITYRSYSRQSLNSRKNFYALFKPIVFFFFQS